jgi:hypothetical protein
MMIDRTPSSIDRHGRQEVFEEGTIMPMHSDHESLGAYSPQVLGGRPVTAGDVAYMKEVFERIIDEAEDAFTTATMFEPYAKVTNFVLANRKIRQQVSETPQDNHEGPAI